jgi:predicted metal-dependent HD superfamily phosphohydrolase
MNQDDSANWIKLAKKYSDDEVLIGRLFNELKKKYGLSSRHYHNWRHIACMLKFCDEYAMDLHEKDIVQFAIYYHDFVYNVLRKDNEQRSANIAARHLQQLQVPVAKIEHVKAFIAASQNHQVPVHYPLSTDIALFLDFDMHILGEDWETYMRYTEEIRREYQIYPSPMYNAGRRRFLEGCLARISIYNTPQFRMRFELAAHENILKELALYQ